jgi:hypothetical protein
MPGELLWTSQPSVNDAASSAAVSPPTLDTTPTTKPAIAADQAELLALALELRIRQTLAATPQLPHERREQLAALLRDDPPLNTPRREQLATLLTAPHHGAGAA